MPAMPEKQAKEIASLMKPPTRGISPPSRSPSSTAPALVPHTTSHSVARRGSPT